MSKSTSAQAKKGKSASPWSRWNPPVCKYPELNTSKRLREPCGATPKGSATLRSPHKQLLNVNATTPGRHARGRYTRSTT